jgi:hypothetical protein
MTLRIGEADDILPFMKNGVTRFLANTFQGVDVQWQANYKYHFAKEHELLTDVTHTSPRKRTIKR